MFFYIYRDGGPMHEWQYRKVDLNDLPRRVEDIDLLNDADAFAYFFADQGVASLSRAIHLSSGPGYVSGNKLGGAPAGHAGHRRCEKLAMFEKLQARGAFRRSLAEG